jgi:hypothetical protein
MSEIFAFWIFNEAEYTTTTGPRANPDSAIPGSARFSMTGRLARF